MPTKSESNRDSAAKFQEPDAEVHCSDQFDVIVRNPPGEELLPRPRLVTAPF